MRSLQPDSTKVFGTKDLQILKGCKLQSSTIEWLAGLCHGQRLKMEVRTAKEKKQPTHKERAVLFGQVSSHASELLRLFNGGLLIEDLCALHDEVERLDAEEAGSMQFDPKSWGPALGALQKWSEAAKNLQATHAALKRPGRSPAPQWRGEFLMVVARRIAEDGIGIRTKGGRFKEIAAICYRAANIPASPDSDIKAFLSAPASTQIGA